MMISSTRVRRRPSNGRVTEAVGMNGGSYARPLYEGDTSIRQRVDWSSLDERSASGREALATT